MTKASELRPGQFFEFVGDHMHTRWRSLASRIEGRAWYMNSHFVMYWCGLDCEVTPLAVAGWDDEVDSEPLIQAGMISYDNGETWKYPPDVQTVAIEEMRTSALKDLDEAKTLVSQLQDNRALVKGRWYRTRFGVMECKSGDPLKAFDDSRIESMGDVFEEVNPAPSTPEPCNCDSPKELAYNVSTGPVPQGSACIVNMETGEKRIVPYEEAFPSTPEPFKAGDLVVCVDDTNSDLVGGKLYCVENVSVNVRDLKLVDTHCWWMHDRFRHATAAEIEQYMQSHPEARSKSMQKRIEAMTEPKPLQLAEGKYYKRRDKFIVGPAVHDPTGNWPWRIGDFYYDNDGTFSPEPQSIDLVREVPPPTVAIHELNDGAPTRLDVEVPPPVSEPAKVDAWRVSPSRSTGDYEEHLTVDGARQHIQELLDEWEWSDDLTIAIENVEVVEPAKLEQKRQDDEGWIAWHSNRCPTELSQLVRVVWREDGSESKCYLAREVDWGAVTHYRVVEQPPVSGFNSSGSKYLRKIVTTDSGCVDVYAVLLAFNVTCPARQHAIKKLLCSGIRGKGDELQDLQEAHDAVDRAIQLNNEPCGVRE